MEARQPADHAAILQWLGVTWGECLGKVIEGMTGERPQMRPLSGAEVPAEAAAGKALSWAQDLDLAAGAAAWVWMPEEAWSALGARALRAAGVEEVAPEEVKGTCLELLTQCHAAMAQAIGDRLQRTVLATTGRETEGLPAGVVPHRLQIQYPDAALGPVEVAFSSRLVKALGEPEPDSAGSLAPRQQPAGNLPEIPPQASATLDLLRDVELPVSVSFGRAQLALRDVLKLAAGSVIELDRSIDEPVALIVNNTVVALGDVVVIDGNYGLRIQQILSREKLLRSSGVE
ncbi:MAG TPA: flagellar motor switch protein FliN [Bryobacteraceae bacterium]|nr:flagellar motor switch protein FliN [Bryobacteraceae bacterium]